MSSACEANRVHTRWVVLSTEILALAALENAEELL